MAGGPAASIVVAISIPPLYWAGRRAPSSVAHVRMSGEERRFSTNSKLRMMSNSYWTQASDAERYARSRPSFHALVIERIKAFLEFPEPIRWALDIGCGTGQSATTLRAIATDVVGLDISPAMLDYAQDPSVQFLRAAGESLPFADHRFDLATAALSFHWLDRDRFLAEARRVLRPAGWLVIYDNFFLGRMRENSDFEPRHEEYLTRYPLPPRHNRPLTPEVAGRHGFLFVKEETYTNEVTFSSEELASYLMTQTNVLAAIQAGTEDREEIYRWLANSVKPLFPRRLCDFCFGGYIRFLSRQAEPKES